MADFEDNPFADPSAINPFADPSVQQANSDTPNVDEYNPFEEGAKEPEPPNRPPPPNKAPEKKKAKKEAKPSGPQRPKFEPPASPAVLPPEPPPSYEPGPARFASPREDDLRKREEEISKRESDLLEREKNLSTLGPDARAKNFPPLPKFCPCQPCFYINISEEIPPTERWKVKMLVVLLFVYTLMLFLNMILTIPGAVVSTVHSGDNSAYLPTSAIVAIVLGILWLFLLPVASLFCWFMPAYYAYRKDSSLAFMWFFFIMVIQCACWVIFALGPPGFSVLLFIGQTTLIIVMFGACVYLKHQLTLTSVMMCGIISGASVLSVGGGQPVIGGIWIAFSVFWMLLIPWGGVLIFLIHRYYRASGGTLDKAASEAAKGAASNKYVRDAAKGAVKAGVSAATSGGGSED